MGKTQFSKIKIKRSSITGVVPTLGATTDHTDGTWLATDIYPGEFFYNVVDNRLWIGKVGGIQEISTAQLFELTYADAQALKDINGSPVMGAGLIIGAIYKITDRGDNGLILQAIGLDKFSNYCDELYASPVDHIPAIFDFDNDILTYPSGANYKSLIHSFEQTSTNTPVINILDNTFATTPSYSRSVAGNYLLTITGAFANTAKVWIGNCSLIGNSATVYYPLSQGSSIDGYFTFGINDSDSLFINVLDNTFTPVDLSTLTIGDVLFFPEIRVYN